MSARERMFRRFLFLREVLARVALVAATVAMPFASFAGELDLPQFEIRWGQRGTEDGEFDFPSGVAVGLGGNVYVADSLNHRIQMFDRDGNLLLKWGTFCKISNGTGCEGEGDGQFNEPRGVTVDANGDVYVADTLNFRLQKFDADGVFLMKWGSFGNGDGQFAFPADVAVAQDGTIHVVDNNLSRLTKFDATGTFVTSWATAVTPRGVAVDDEGNVFVITTNARRAQKFDADGTLITEWGDTGGEPSQFLDPEGIEVDDNGNVFVADTGNGRIQQFDNDGNFTLEFGKGALSSPVDVAIGSFFIVERVGRVQRWGLVEPTPTATGAPTETPAPGTPLPACVADCNGDGKVAIDELIVGVGIALGNQSLDNCPVLDTNDDGAVAVNELVAGVNNAVAGCGS